MPEDEALIQFSIGKFFSFASVITKEDYTITHLQRRNPISNPQQKWKLTTHSEVSGLVKDLRKNLQLVGSKPGKFDLEKSSILFDMLFTENIFDILKDKKKLVIVPDGPLYGLPFELLYEKKNKKWLVEKYSITVSPSSYSYAALNLDKKDPYNSKNSFAGFGNPKSRT